MQAKDNTEETEDTAEVSTLNTAAMLFGLVTASVTVLSYSFMNRT